MRMRRRAGSRLQAAVVLAALGIAREPHDGWTRSQAGQCLAEHQLAFGYRGPLRPEGHRTTSKRRIARAAQGIDFLSGEKISRKAVLLFETERGNANAFLWISASLAFAGGFGLFYNALGQLAANTSNPSAATDDVYGLVLEFIAFVLGVFGFGSVNQMRTNTLKRLDAELSFESLEVELADGTGLTRKVSEFRGKSRVLAVFSFYQDELATAIQAAAAYRRRWMTSDVVVVAVGPTPSGMSGRWLARAKNPDAWTKRKEALSSEEQVGASWVLLGKSGRVRGESEGTNWDQVLCFTGVKENLSKLPELAPGLPTGNDESLLAILNVHSAFYDALIAGDADGMRPLWMDSGKPDSDMDAKRRVAWDSVLSEKANVLGVVDVDVVFDQSGNDATVTAIELCADTGGFMNEGGPDGKGSLLATKRLRRDETGNWRLISHQTIPYCRNTFGNQSLVCTCNGCMLLKRQ